MSLVICEIDDKKDFFNKHKIQKSHYLGQTA